MSRFELDGEVKKMKPGTRVMFTLRGHQLDADNVPKKAHATVHPPTYEDMREKHWEALGAELGFDPDTVLAVGGDRELFTAVTVK